ncbi:MAG: phosphotransferase enzyme family protein [Alphaproteobacteria bacterium]
MAAAGQGLTVDEVEPLSVGSNFIFHLWPHEIVARVSGIRSQILPGGEEETARRELDVVRFLGDAGAPVARLCRDVDPGPHRHDGLVITFWERVFEGEVSDYAPRSLEALRACHAALRSYAGALPYLRGYAEARRVFLHLWRTEALDPARASDVVRRLAVLDQALDRIREDDTVVKVPIHGDAHLGNILTIGEAASAPVLWIDWDDVCLGPVEWDFASLIVEFRKQPDRPDREAVLRAVFADEIDTALLDIMIDARTLQIEMWDAALETA